MIFRDFSINDSFKYRVERVSCQIAPAVVAFTGCLSLGLTTSRIGAPVESSAYFLGIALPPYILSLALSRQDSFSNLSPWYLGECIGPWASDLVSASWSVGDRWKKGECALSRHILLRTTSFERNCTVHVVNARQRRDSERGIDSLRQKERYIAYLELVVRVMHGHAACIIPSDGSSTGLPKRTRGTRFLSSHQTVLICAFHPQKN